MSRHCKSVVLLFASHKCSNMSISLRFKVQTLDSESVSSKSRCPHFQLFVSDKTNLGREAELELHLCLQCWRLYTCRSPRPQGPHPSKPGCHWLIPGSSGRPWSRQAWALGRHSPRRAAPTDGPLAPSSPWGQAECLEALQGSSGGDD